MSCREYGEWKVLREWQRSLVSKLAALLSSDAMPVGCWFGGVMGCSSAYVCPAAVAGCAGLRRGSTGDSRIVVNELDVVATVGMDSELCLCLR